MKPQPKTLIEASVLILTLLYGQTAHCQTGTSKESLAIQTPKGSAELYMKDPETVPITDKWMRDNPGRLVASVSAACNGIDYYTFEFHTSKEALFRTQITMWIAIDKNDLEFPVAAVESTSTTTSPSKTIKFSVNIPRTTREIEAVVEVVELRKFTMLGGHKVFEWDFGCGLAIC